MKSAYALLLLFLAACSSVRQTATVSLPGWMKGKFTDDYGISYTVTDSLFTLEPSARYHIMRWNETEQYLLTRNDTANKTDKGLYTRIDYMRFSDMAPYTWGFCLTVYDAKDTTAALRAAPADRNNPRKGCNSFPFSRMKRSN